MKNSYAVYVTNSPTLLTSNSKRQSVAFRNSGSTTIYLGNSASMTAPNGFYLKQDEILLDEDSYSARNGGVSPWYGITLSGSSLMTVLESMD